jgi:hypothetical protein
LQPLLKKCEVGLEGKGSEGVMRRREEERQKDDSIYRKRGSRISAMKREITMTCWRNERTKQKLTFHTRIHRILSRERTRAPIMKFHSFLPLYDNTLCAVAMLLKAVEMDLEETQQSSSESD